MKTIETYREWKREGKALNPKLGDMELPQLIGDLASAYENLNAIKNIEDLPIPTQQHLFFAMHHLDVALRQLDIDVECYKI